MSGFFWVSLCAVSIIYGATAQTANICNMTYYWRWKHFQNCCYEFDVPAPDSLIMGSEFTGNNVTDLMNQFCTKSAQVKQCITKDVAVCDESVQDTVSSAADRSTAFCGPDGRVSSELKQIFESEEILATPEDRNVTRCHEGIETVPCSVEAKGKSGATNDMHHTKTTAELFADDTASDYFRYFFQCLHKKVAAKCPSNAMTMTVGLSPNAFTQSRFGIDMAAILLEAAADWSVDQ